MQFVYIYLEQSEERSRRELVTKFSVVVELKDLSRDIISGNRDKKSIWRCIMAESKRLVKATVFYTRKPEVSEEEFHKFWSETYGPLFCSLPITQQKVVKYNQYHSEPAWKSKAVGLGLPVMEFDGVAEVWIEDIESLGILLRDPTYLGTVAPDLNKLINKEASKFMFGYDIVQLDRS